MGWKRRRANYDVFRNRLPASVRLVTVEHAYDGEFELAAGDADVLVQVAGGDVMWQKERLLNLALARVPSGSAVAWLDCDVVLTPEDWPERAVAALKEHVVVQPFSDAYWLGPDQLPEDADGAVWESHRRSLGFQRRRGALGPAARRAWACPRTGLPLPDGYAWVARREVLDRHGFYDASVIGGGTREFALAALGDLATLAGCRPRTPAQLEHVMAWAEPFAADVAGQVGCSVGATFHLWHGSLCDRRHGVRHREFLRFGFDPAGDLASIGSGCWRWSSDKPEMHAWIRDYLRSRREDGAPDPEQSTGVER